MFEAHASIRLQRSSYCWPHRCEMQTKAELWRTRSTTRCSCSVLDKESHTVFAPCSLSRAQQAAASCCQPARPPYEASSINTSTHGSSAGLKHAPQPKQDLSFSQRIAQGNLLIEPFSSYFLITSGQGRTCNMPPAAPGEGALPALTVPTQCRSHGAFHFEVHAKKFEAIHPRSIFNIGNNISKLLSTVYKKNST